MPLFDTHVMVDWSARSTPSPKKPTKDAIWWAVARGGTVAEIKYVRTRHAAGQGLYELIATELSAGRRVLVGFDFPFGYPAGVARHLAGSASAIALWAWLAGRIEDAKNNANNRFAVATEINSTYSGVGPFWGRHPDWHCPGVSTRASDRSSRCSHPAEKRIADEGAAGAKTVWQLFYSGSVGSQALLGIPALDRLRKTPVLSEHTAVWPFDSGLRVPDEPVVLAEIYPSLLKEAIAERGGKNEILDCAQMRVTAEVFASLDSRGALVPLFGGSPELTTQERRIVEAEEAWILGLGHEKALRGALVPRS